jgi:hypothetical protein
MRTRLAAALLFCASLLQGAELFTLSPSNHAACSPGGKEADAIIGDYVLRNDRITAAVADPRLMSGRSASRWAIPNVAGALIDLTLRGQSNDLLTAFYPAIPRFKPDAPNYQHEFTDETQAWLTPGREPVSAPRVTLALPAYELDSGKSVEILEALPVHLRASPRPRVEVRYILEDGWDYLRIETEYVNPTEASVEITPFMSLRVDDARMWENGFDSHLIMVSDPWWHPSYGVVTPDHSIQSASTKAPRFVLGDLIDAKPSFTLPPGGRRTLVRCVTAGGIESIYATAAALLGTAAPPRPIVKMPPSTDGFADVAVVDDSGKPLPARIVYRGCDGTADPFFFPATGETRVRNAVHTSTGTSLDPLPPGRYDVTVSFGPEYNAFTQAITVATAKTNTIRAVLTRAYSTPGWISADLHNHSTLSGASEIFYVYPYSKDPTADGDSTASTRGRVLSLLASGIEFAVPAEHNFSSTFEPLIRELGMKDRLATCPGIGLTAGRRHTVTHQNVFPAPHVPGRQDGGVLQRPEHVGQLEWMLKWSNTTEKLVQIVVPRGDTLRPAPGMDVVDVVDLEPLVEGKPLESRDNRILDWIARLNEGYRLPAVVSAGAFNNEARAGSVRTYVRVPDDNPATLNPFDVARACKKGHVLLTTGPFLEVSLTGDNEKAIAGPGDSISMTGTKAALRVRVRVSNAAAVDRVQVLVNGKTDPALDFRKDRKPDLFPEGTTAFEQTVGLTVAADAHVIVIASGKGSGRRHVAVSNPIWIDAGADGYLPRSPLDDTVMTKLDFVASPLAREGEKEPGRVRLELSNTGKTEERGVARLDIAPASAASVPGPVERPYTIAPGGQAHVEWPILLSDALIATGFPIRSTYNNAGTFGIRVPRGTNGASHRAANTFMSLDYPFRSLPPLPSPDGLDQVLKEERPFPVLDASRKPLAECRWGVSGSNLAFHAVVRDPAPERRALQWESSCIELFGSLPGRSSQNKPTLGYFPIRQVYLLARAGDAPAAAFKRVAEGIVPASEIAIVSTPVKGGYAVSALIPLSLLGADVDLIARNVFFAGQFNPPYLIDLDPRPGRILLEARVTAPRPAPQPPLRGTIFGSPAPHADHNAFGRMRLMGDVQATLTVLAPISLAPEAPPARISLTLTNNGKTVKTDTVSLQCDPAGAVTFKGPSSLPFTLPPGASTSVVFELTPNGAPALPWVNLVVTRSPGGAIAGTPSPRLPILDRPLGGIAAPGTLDEVRKSLAGRPPLVIPIDGKPAAEIRIALAPGALALHAVIRGEPGPPQDPPWKGSCLEVFSAASDTNAMAHLFLVQAYGDKPAAGLVAEEDQSVKVPDIQVQSARTPDGCEMTALIPLRLLELPASPERLKLEFQLGLPGADGKMLYGTTFGSTRAYMTPLSYGTFRIIR